MKEYKKQNGWTISLYTDEGQSNDRVGGYNFLSWSPYDRIEVHITQAFKNFIFPKDEWCGVTQQLHLIPYYYIVSGEEELEDTEWICDNYDETLKTSSLLVRRKEAKNTYYGLQCIVTGRLNNALLAHILDTASNSQKKNILKGVTKNLSEFGSKNKMRFDCVSFETLGSEDFAFMIFADRIEEFSKLISLLRQQKISSSNKSLNCEMLFSNICTIMGFNKNNYSYEPTIEAVVKISAKSIKDRKSIVEKIENGAVDNKVDVFETLQGINVFEVYFKPKDLTLWHGPTHNASDAIGILNGESHEYKKYISSSRTFWLYKESDDKNVSEDINKDSNLYTSISYDNEIIANKENRTLNTEMANCSSDLKRNKVTSKIINNNDDRNQVFKFILSEYERMINLKRCIEWREILKEQQECLSAFEGFYNDNDKTKRVFADGMQAVLTHINQACTPVYEIPYHNHFYSGSFDNILKMYYGIIRFIINKGNSIPREPEYKPTKFSFGIRFDSVENIQTRVFSTDQQEYRFIIFQLPYSALYDFDTNAELLVHEVFHYITPINRKFRNKQILDVWMTFLLLKLKDFCQYKSDSSVSDCSISSLIDNILQTPELHSKYLETYYKTLQDEFSDYDKYEMSVFSNLEFMELACHTFCALFSSELHKTNITEWRNLTNKAKKYSLRDNPDEIDAMDALHFWLLTTQDVLRSMNELVSTVKEVFCDLFMCSLYNLDFKQYLGLLTKYSLKQEIVIAEDEMALAYRIRMISSILYAKYDLEKYAPIISDKEMQLIEQVMQNVKSDVPIDNNIVKKLVYKVGLAGKSSYVCNAIVETLKYEIDYLHMNSNQFSKLGECTIRDFLVNTDSESTFSHHIKMINTFIDYNEIETASIITDSSMPHFSCSTMQFRNYNITSLGEYIGLMTEISERVDGQLWYRGVCNCEYELLPSLLRQNDPLLPLYVNQVKSLKKAYDVTMQYPELWNGKIQEQISLLQHYGMPTNMLDFTLDMLTSLHFAINPDKADDQDKIQSGEITPAIYAFDPMEYSHAVESLKNQIITNERFNVSPILYEIADDNMENYFPKRMEEPYLRNLTVAHKEKFKPTAENTLYPVPVIIRHSHERIRVQGGTFVAFDLRSKPDFTHPAEQVTTTNPIGPYSYLDLKKTELLYEELQKKNGISKPHKFLYEMRIERSAIKSIQNEIKALRITKSSVYPELHNIFKEAQEGLF